MIRTWLVLLALALPVAAAQPAPPQVAAERWIDAFLELHDARDAAGLRTFVRDRIDPRTLGLFGGPENAARRAQFMNPCASRYRRTVSENSWCDSRVYFTVV